MDKIQTRNRLVAIVVLIFVLLWAGLVEPDKGILTNCFFLEKTGHPCPTCGMSRSFYATFHFDFQDAFQFHLLGPVLYLILLIAFVKFSWEVIINRVIQSRLMSRYLNYLFFIFVLVMILNWIYMLLNTTVK